MKCKICKESIDFHVFGAPKDLCWGCLKDKSKEAVVKQNLKLVNN